MCIHHQHCEKHWRRLIKIIFNKRSVRPSVHWEVGSQPAGSLWCVRKLAISLLQLAIAGEIYQRHDRLTPSTSNNTTTRQLINLTNHLFSADTVTERWCAVQTF